METILYNYRNSRILNVTLFILVIILMVYSCNQHQKAVKNQLATEIVEKYIQPDTTDLIEKSPMLDTSRTVPLEAVVPPLKSDPVYRTIIEYFDSASKSSSLLKERVSEVGLRPVILVTTDTLKYIRKIDSLERLVWYSNSFKNDYLTYIPTEKDSTNTVRPASYRYNAKIIAEQGSETNKVFWLPIGKKKSFVQLTSLDTNATINGLRTYRSSINEPRYGLRIQGVMGYNFTTRSPTFGPAIRMDIGRFSISNSYPYNFKIGRATYALSITGDIIRF